MTTYRKDLGAGFHRTTMDFLKGFSLSFSLILLWVGLIGSSSRSARTPRGLGAGRARLRGPRGRLLAINVTYFFLPPLVCVAVIFLAFLAAVLGGAGQTRPPR